VVLAKSRLMPSAILRATGKKTTEVGARLRGEKRLKTSGVSG
jgi:hypothetical protein